MKGTMIIKYLHLGQSVVVPETEIIGIFDLDNTTGSHSTRKFLSSAEKKGHVINVSDELPKSFIVSGVGRDIIVHLSQLSPQTLLKRTIESNH
ncbi:MAG: DUF370 domain-containing protein [Oscillospiraceae bacterium]|jgi:hypothetical protein|nr:DUF370 domain-containing protein [Oscillospiraceae bacterium]